MRGTQLQLPWSRPSTLLTKCHSRRMLHLAFHTCSNKVWPTSQLVRTHPNDKCRSTCGHLRTGELVTHPTLPSPLDHLRDCNRGVPSSMWTPTSSTLPTSAREKTHILWAKLLVSVLGFLDLTTYQSSTTHVTLHPCPPTSA